MYGLEKLSLWRRINSKKSFRSVRFIIETFDRTERNLDLIESYKTSIESEKTIIR